MCFVSAVKEEAKRSDVDDDKDNNEGDYSTTDNWAALR